MNGSISANAQTTSEHARQPDRVAQSAPNKTSPRTDSAQGISNGVHNDEPDSEAETLITSPVKKAEAAKQYAAARQRDETIMTRHDRPQDGDLDAVGSPDSPRTRSVPKSSIKLKASKAPSDGNESDTSSPALSAVSDDEESSATSSIQSRGTSHLDAKSSNPRKRKHRGSSVSLPNKRPSIDTSRRRKRGATEDRHVADGNEQPDSPQTRGHRRAASIQSTQDGQDNQGSRKRRSIPLGRDGSKSTRRGWDEESMSSETTSHGQQEQKRPQRGIGRSTSTPGRPVGREAKRHVNKYGYTRLAEACEAGDLDLVKEWREKDPDQLEIAEFAGNKPLQIAAINGNAEVVSYLIAEGCRIDCENEERDTPLLDAAENGHANVVDILLEAGVDPLRQNRKGQQALDVINDDTENVTEIRASLRAAIERWSSDDAKQRREEEEEQRYRGGPSKELHFMARSYENLLRLVTLNDRNSVREFLDARVPVDNAVIAAAAKTGDLYLVNMLLAEMSEKKRYQKAEKPMLSVLGTGHFGMVKTLTELDQFNPRWRNRQDKSWSEIAEEKAGPMWRQEVELLRRLEKEALDGSRSRQSSSPIMRRTEKARHSSSSKANNDSDDNETEAGTPKQRKIGRRLLSRKDMRVGSGGKKRNQTSEDSGTEDGEAIKVASSPTEKRGPGRPRTKPAVVKVEVGDEHEKHSDGRRATSHKAAAAQPTLSGVEEKVEDHTVKVDSAHTERTDKSPSVTIGSPTSKDQESKLNNSIEPSDEATDQVDVKMAGTGAMTQQEELDRQHAAEQEQAQQAEEQRLRAEEEAKLKELEAARLEEERQAAETEMARNQARREIINALPQSMAHHLDSTSDFSYDELGAVDTILRHVEPLQIVYTSDLSTEQIENASSGEPLVLNLSVAPLLGKEKGLDSLLQDQHFPAGDWATALVVLEEEKRLLLPLLRNIIYTYHDNYEDEMMADDQQNNFTEELRKAAQMHKFASQAYRQLLAAPLTMRWLSLDRIMEQMHPIFHSQDIAISEEWRSVLHNGLRRQSTKVLHRASDFFDDVSIHWQRPLVTQTHKHGQALAMAIADSSGRLTDVQVVGQG